MSKEQQSFAEKYRAYKYEDIIGQDTAIKELENFLATFPKGKKAMILYGPAGTGKTTLALAAAKRHNLEILELNASDVRNRKKLEEVVSPAVTQQSLFKKGKLILMDEADGITGTDIGGVPELVKLIEETQFPMVLTCNDVWQTKMSPLRAKSKLVELKALSVLTIVDILKDVCQKEALKKESSFLMQIAIKSQGDVRAALNDLQSYSKSENLFVDVVEKRDVEESIFNILRQIFKERGDFLEAFDHTSLSLDEILLWIEENIPKEYKGESLLKAYLALANADVFRGRIYKNQSWRFLIYQNIFQSAGISYAKPTALPGFTKYERPKRVLKIWLHNQKVAKKKSIAIKFARLVHCSAKRAMRDFNLLMPIINKESVRAKLELSDEEVAFLENQKHNVLPSFEAIV